MNKCLRILILTSLIPIHFAGACWGDSDKYDVSFQPGEKKDELIVTLKGPPEVNTKIPDDGTKILNDDTGFVSAYFGMAYLYKKNKGQVEAPIEAKDLETVSFIKNRLRYMENQLMNVSMDDYRKNIVLNSLSNVQALASNRKTTYLDLIGAFNKLEGDLRKQSVNVKAKFKQDAQTGWDKKGTQFDFHKMVEALDLPSLEEHRGCSSEIEKFNIGDQKSSQNNNEENGFHFPTFNFGSSTGS